MHKQQFQQNLLQWFAKNQRTLPWRKHYKPYEVWVSEIMLQQTQMDTALPYYDRWMKAFPSVEALAAAPESQVLKLWEGLGYYSRARNIHHSAKKIMAEFSGKFPEDFESILSLKGVGRYSAGAISSIAFNQPKPIVDGNVFRVLARIYAIDKPIDVEKNRKEFWKLQENLIPEGEARHFNQALMELGALICTTANPSCAICPLKDLCRAYKTDTAENYPVKQHKKKAIKVQAAALVLRSKNRYWIRFRPVGEIMGGLWEFPEWKLSKNKTLKFDKIQKKLESLSQKELAVDSKQIKFLGQIKRNYTVHLEDLFVFGLNLDEQNLSMPLEGGWKTAWADKKDFSKFPFSSAHAKIVKLLSER